MLPADYYSVNPQHPHWPLIVMLVLTQLSVGAFAIGLALESVLSENLLATFRPVQSLLALMLGLLALGASTLHLGRPQYAFRAVIGLRHSWLSREIVAFGLFAGTAAMYAALIQWVPLPADVLHAVGWAVVVTGGLGIFCSIMIYVFTQREFWSFGQTATKFVLTAVNLGLATTFLVLLLFAFLGDRQSADQFFRVAGRPLAQALMIGMSTKLLFEASLLRYLGTHRNSPLKRSALLLVGPLASSSLARLAAGVLGGIVMPMFLMLRQTNSVVGDIPALIMVLFLFVACVGGELLERYQFFAAVAAPRMPGGPRR